MPRQRLRTLPLCVLAAALALTGILLTGILAGCGDDGGAEPVVAFSLGIDSTAVEVCATLQLTATLGSSQPSDVDWYVGGVLGGSNYYGTISQTNPATYTPPARSPEPAAVVVKAVLRSDAAKSDSCKVTVRFTNIYVSASAGNDDTGTGCVGAPFRSITRGLAAADSGSTVWVAAGTYDEDHGETFSLAVPRGVALIGEDWETTIIRCLGYDENAGMAVGLSWPRSTIRRFTIDQGTSPVTELNAMVSTGAYSNGCVIDSIITGSRGAWNTIGVGASISTTISNCRLLFGGEPDGRGIVLSQNDTGTIIRNCTISGFDAGIFMVGDSDVLVEGCTLENNVRGAELCCSSSIVSNPNPDFGGGARGSTGGNIIRNNAACGLTNAGGSTVFAKHNTWANDPPVAGDDYCNDGAGSIVVE
jgi:parallel beta-helix repeat protein